MLDDVLTTLGGKCLRHMLFSQSGIQQILM